MFYRCHGKILISRCLTWTWDDFSYFPGFLWECEQLPSLQPLCEGHFVLLIQEKKGVSRLQIQWLEQDLPQPCKAAGNVGVQNLGAEGPCKAHRGLKQRGSISSSLEDSQKARASLDWAGSPLLLSVFLSGQLPGVTKPCFPGARARIRAPSPAALQSRGSADGRSLGDAHFPTKTPEKGTGHAPCLWITSSTVATHSIPLPFGNWQTPGLLKKKKGEKKTPELAVGEKKPRIRGDPGGKVWAQGGIAGMRAGQGSSSTRD